jgi:ABC-type branched-subunit amino acid transport system substrate-binding protein
MKSKTRLAWAALASASLIIAACGGDDSSSSDSPSTEAPAATDAPSETDAPADTEAPAEERTASDTGITADTIKIGVAVSDLAAIRAVGISVPETLTTEHLFDRYQVFVDDINEAGGINGRMIELTQVVWNPLDQSTFDTLCAAATIDNELFAVMNGTGLSAIARRCLFDSGMIIMYGDVMSQSEFDTGLAIGLAPPSEAVAAAGARAWIESTDAPAGSVVGVLSNNGPSIQPAGEAAKAVLEEAGFEVILIELNSQSGDNAAISEEGAAAVGAFQAEGAVHALLTTPFTENQGFWNSAAEAKFPFSLLDSSSSGCSAFGLSRVAAAAYGTECITAYDHSTDGTSLREDSEFEAACRANFDENFEAYYGGKSYPGVPAGQIIVDANGKQLVSDYTPQECALMNILKLGLEGAGVNPTRASFVDAVLNLGEVPLALAGGGTGLFAPDKPYAANAVHTVRITGADPSVAPDANGLYNGCAAPIACGIVISDWVSIR